jgi:hypothetical protein
MKISMLKEGKYSVWMRTPLAEGMGVVVLAPDGTLRGGDSIMSYTGHWRTDGEQFEATLFTGTRPVPAQFGEVDDLDFTPDRSVQGRRHRLMQGHLQASAGLDVGATLVRTADG